MIPFLRREVVIYEKGRSHPAVAGELRCMSGGAVRLSMRIRICRGTATALVLTAVQSCGGDVQCQCLPTRDCGMQEIQPGLEKVFFTLQQELYRPLPKRFAEGATLPAIIQQSNIPLDRQRIAEALFSSARPALPNRSMP